MDKDYRWAICEGIGEEVAKRWPELTMVLSNCCMIDSWYPQLQIRLPAGCLYIYVHITCNEYIYIDADGDYGPDMQFEYEDPECVNNVLAFILAVSSVHVCDLPHEIIELTEWKRRLGNGGLTLTEWRKML